MAGMATLAILGIAAVVATITFQQMEAWAPTWEAWLAADQPDGGGFYGERLKFLKMLPTFTVIAQISVVMALAFSSLVRGGR